MNYRQSQTCLETSKTINGSCGGNFTICINADDQTGDFTGNINFNSFCEAGATISGPTDISGKVDLYASDIDWIKFSFGLMTITYYGGSTSMTGDITLTRSGSTDTMVMEVLTGILDN